MLAKLLISAAFLFQSATPLKWVGDVFAPGETVSYSHPHAHLQAGSYVVTVVNEAGKESDIPGEAAHGDLAFTCPELPNGFYEIAGARSQRTGKMYYGLINGAQGFYIERP